ncbi:MAG: hypothetical protein P8X65_15265, partial [Syntrophobacterales bacterium]
GEVPFLSLLGPSEQKPLPLESRHLEGDRKGGMFVPPTVKPPIHQTPGPTGPSYTVPSGPHQESYH